ncbi:SPFH domain containing protein 1 [Sarcoptes scabiei]|uniref:SPFH domain containing protein 1 n=1 Tax=Sarcoptes scabiei TaxID=52283 RepID=A0A131ZYD8_SARSC|nr:SPFH domain containing protein 1 [Sarcoptes scabiei]
MKSSRSKLNFDSIFDYSSSFSYQKILDFDFGDFNPGDREEKHHRTIAERLIYSILKRCQISRLGFLLPLKGPGLILKLPFIDKITIIDLEEHWFDVVPNDCELWTADGSIILMKKFQANLLITDASLTTLKLNNIDVERLIQLRFVNLIQSTHIEDLETKMYYIEKGFEEKMNAFLKKWGYAIKMKEDCAKIIVVEKADPLNSIKMKLRGLLQNTSSSNQEDQIDRNSLKKISKFSDTQTMKRIDQELIDLMENFCQQNKFYLHSYDSFIIKIIIEKRILYLKYQNGSLHECLDEPNRIDMTVWFETEENLEQFIRNRSFKYLSYKFH